MIYDFYKSIIKNILESQRDLSEVILNGNSVTFDEYKRLAGRLSGLKDAQAIVIDEYKKLYKFEDSRFDRNDIS